MSSPDRVRVSPAQHQVLRRRSWRASIALLVCFCVVASALHTVLQKFDWWFIIAGTVLAVLGTAAITRAISRRTWLPTVLGSLVLLGLLTFFFASGTAFLFVIPTLESLSTFGDLGQAGAMSIAGQAVPAVATPGVTFLVCLGSGALAVVADFVAVTWRRPALAGAPLAVILVIPTFIGVQLADVFIFILAAIAWLVLLRAGDPFPQTARALGIGALAIVAALLVPFALPHVDETDARGGGAGGNLASVNPVLTLGEELRREVPQTILTYSTQSDDAAYLRLVSLQNFLADTWKPDAPVIDRGHVPSEVGPSPGLSPDVRVDDETTWVDVKNLDSPWLPVPFLATSVSGLRGDWYWNAADLTFTSPDRAARGEQYRVQSLLMNPTPAQLDAASGTRPVSLDNEGGLAQKYLALPSKLPPIISEMAKAVTASATNDYGRAVALQEYFRDGQFAYSETAPADNGYDDSGMTAIAQFLEAKSGYCIHFASAMAVMARTLGIPSRVAIGFLPGDKDGSTVDGRAEYRVSTDNLHSWPELYFEGIGWTRFEPTPGRGYVPRYADETVPGVPVTPKSDATPTASPTPTTAPSRSAAPLTPDDSTANSPTNAAALWWLWMVLVGVGIAVLLLLPAVVRAAQRAVRLRRLARGHPAASTGWRELLHTADDLGVRISATATPRDAAAALARAAKLERSGENALIAVRELVERQSFARETSVPLLSRAARKNVAGEVAVDCVTEVLGHLRAAAGWRARVRATIAPRSVWVRDGQATRTSSAD